MSNKKVEKNNYWMIYLHDGYDWQLVTRDRSEHDCFIKYFGLSSGLNKGCAMRLVSPSGEVVREKVRH